MNTKQKKYILISKYDELKCELDASIAKNKETLLKYDELKTAYDLSKDYHKTYYRTKLQNKMKYCDVCKKNIHCCSWSNHIRKDEKHLILASVNNTPIPKTYCDVCDKIVVGMEQHQKGKKHKERLLKDSLAIVQMNTDKDNLLAEILDNNIEK